jgi:hypothetical protein
VNAASVAIIPAEAARRFVEARAGIPQFADEHGPEKLQTFRQDHPQNQ